MSPMPENARILNDLNRKGWATVARNLDTSRMAAMSFCEIHMHSRMSNKVSTGSVDANGYDLNLFVEMA